MPSNSICDTCRHGSYVSIGCPAKYRDVFFDDYTREVVDCKYYSKQVSMLERLLNEAKEIELLLHYYYNKSLRLQDDIVTYENRYRIRDCDEVDHLESIIAITRLKAFEEFSLEVGRLLGLPPFKGK